MSAHGAASNDNESIQASRNPRQVGKIIHCFCMRAIDPSLTLLGEQARQGLDCPVKGELFSCGLCGSGDGCEKGRDAIIMHFLDHHSAELQNLQYNPIPIGQCMDQYHEVTP